MKIYLPSGPVMAVPTKLLSLSYNLTVTSLTPASPASWIPSRFKSYQTKSPIEPGLNNPKSTVKFPLLSSPSVVGSPPLVNVIAFDWMI